MIPERRDVSLRGRTPTPVRLVTCHSAPWRSRKMSVLSGACERRGASVSSGGVASLPQPPDTLRALAAHRSVTSGACDVGHCADRRLRTWRREENDRRSFQPGMKDVRRRLIDRAVEQEHEEWAYSADRLLGRFVRAYEGGLILRQLEQHAHERRNKRLASNDENLRQGTRNWPASPIGWKRCVTGLQRNGCTATPLTRQENGCMIFAPRPHADVRRRRWSPPAPPAA